MNDIFAKFPKINLKRAILREIKISDAQAFYEYMNNENVVKYIPDDELPSNLISSKNELLYWIDQFKYNTGVYWAIADQKTNKMIGSCGFNYWNKQQGRLEISYDLNYKFWHKGIATEAVDSITDFAFKEMHARRIQATVATDNERSIKLLDSCKYKKEGILKKYFNLRGIIKDAYMYAKLSD